MLRPLNSREKMEKEENLDEFTPPTQHKAGELFGKLKTGGKGHCLRKAMLIKKMRRNPKLMEYLQKITYGTMLEKLESDIEGKIGIAEFVKMICHAKKPSKTKEVSSPAAETVLPPSPPTKAQDDIPIAVTAAAPESSTSKACEAAPAPLISAIPVATASTPVMTTTLPLEPQTSACAEKGTNETVEILSEAIAETETGDASVTAPISNPAKVLHYLCRACRCTLFSVKQLSHGQMKSCRSCFLSEPPAWMIEGLGVMTEKIYCPNKKKCKARLGQIKWVGTTCSCHEWIVPAIQIPKSRLDFKLK